MKDALDWLKRGNDLRKEINAQYGLTEAGQSMTDSNGMKHDYLAPLMVSDYCMVATQIRCNWSESHIGHAPVEYNLAENLAWNFDDGNPYRQWYDDELACILSVKKAYPTDPNWESHIVWSEAGHYYNMVNSRYATAGFAVSTNGSMYPKTFAIDYAYTTKFAPTVTTPSRSTRITTAS